MLKTGDTAPDLGALDKDEREVRLRDFTGKWVVLYFYPKDNTPGCTNEAVEFTALKNDFGKLDAEVVGVSADSPESHRNFAAARSLSITLLSDADHRLLDAFGAWGKKIIYGKEKTGTIRSTFLIDPDRTIREVWPNVKVPGHAKAVLERLQQLRAA
jgi:peroxiredoxin Q/BCP